MKRKKSPDKSTDRRRNVRVLVCTGRENADSRTNDPTDECYREWEFVHEVHFHQSADRVLRELAYVLRGRGFKVRKYVGRSYRAGPVAP